MRVRGATGAKKHEVVVEYRRRKRVQSDTVLSVQDPETTQSYFRRGEGE